MNQRLSGEGLAAVHDAQKPQPPGAENPDDTRHNDDLTVRRKPGIEHSIRPGTPAPHTVLIADMGRGAVFLMGWEIGPSAYLTAEDALGLKRELAKAFDNQDDSA